MGQSPGPQPVRRGRPVREDAPDLSATRCLRGQCDECEEPADPLPLPPCAAPAAPAPPLEAPDPALDLVELTDPWPLAPPLATFAVLDPWSLMPPLAELAVAVPPGFGVEMETGEDP